MAIVPVSATYLFEHTLRGSITPAKVRLACSHRSLSLGGIPADVSMLECHFCGGLTWSLRDHVFRGCPAHFLAEQEVAYRVLQLATVRASGHLEGHESYWGRDGRYSLRVGQDRDVRTAPALAPGAHQLVSTTGVCRTWSCDEVARQSAHTRKAITKAIIKTMAQTEHTLEYLQDKWADITLAISPPRYPMVGADPAA